MTWRILVALTAVTIPAGAAAQALPEPRRVVFADVGHAHTLDDEGFLGAGAALAGSVGLRLTDRLSVHAVVDRIPYHRDTGYLAFDGRAIYAGAEAAFTWRRPRLRPFVTVGAGVMHDRKAWTRRTQTGPGQYRVDGVTHHEYTFAAMRTSGGVEIRLSEAIWLRAVLTMHGLLGSSDDLAAHLAVQPGAGVAWRW